MSATLDDRARAASDAVRVAAELRPAIAPSSRRRAPARVLVTAVVLVVALTVGVFFALRSASPRKGGAASQPSDRYEASATVLATSTAHGRSVVSQDESLVRNGVVPSRVATQLHYHGGPQQLVQQVHVSVDSKTGRITITSTQHTAARAIAVVDAFAEQLVRYLAQVAQTEYDAQVTKALDLTQQLSHERIDVQTQLLTNPNDAALETRAQALRSALANAQTAYAKFVSAGLPEAPVRLVEEDSARRLGSTPHSTSHRSLDVALAVIVLLLLGGALGFGLARHRTVPQG
ncbi:MAG TPA: hypothetical protein VH914_16190 [Acidimicrobiia bacterium]|nr:hypothetical protein [Acidimicrobiia bacterium]